MEMKLLSLSKTCSMSSLHLKQAKKTSKKAHAATFVWSLLGYFSIAVMRSNT